MFKNVQINSDKMFAYRDLHMSNVAFLIVSSFVVVKCILSQYNEMDELHISHSVVFA